MPQTYGWKIPHFFRVWMEHPLFSVYGRNIPFFMCMGGTCEFLLKCVVEGPNKSVRLCCLCGLVRPDSLTSDSMARSAACSSATRSSESLNLSSAWRRNRREIKHAMPKILDPQTTCLHDPLRDPGVNGDVIQLPLNM